MDNLAEGNLTCVTNLTSDQVYSSLALSGLCFGSFIISVLSVVLGLHEYCIKNNLSDLRTERLLLYLTCAGLVFAFFGSFQWLAHFSYQFPVAKLGCTILGYLWFTVAIFYITMTLCIGIHLLLLICKPKLLNVEREEKIRRSKRLEIAYISFAALISVTCSPWPFLNNLFGFNLWVCWIDTMRYDCSEIETGDVETSIFYVALLVVFLFSLSIALVVHVLICLRKRNTSNLYVWIFSTHLVLGLIVIFLVMVISLQKQNLVPSWLRSAKILAIATLPLTISLVTLVAVIYKKCFENHTTKFVRFVNYGSLSERRTINYSTHFNTNSKAPTTFWNSPPTEEITSTGTT